ncbi:MAG: GGDEF domain-containing protein [Gammaproteobacteria bacterium]|nr:GGDEF domain-containing protein [Gammaproteobacteria bacterium]
MVASTSRLEVMTDPGGMHKLLYLIDSLRATPAGNLIYRQAEGMLDDITSSYLRSEMAYAGFVNVLLDAFNAHLTPGSSSYVQIKLLQARLQPPLTPTELDILSAFINQCGDQVLNADELPASIMVDAIKPLLASFGIDTVPPDVAQPPEVETFSGDENVVTEPEWQDDIPAVAEVMPARADDRELQEEFDNTAYISEEIPAGHDLNAINRSELEARRDDVQQLQATLGQQVLETISQNEEFSTILEVVLTELRQAEDVAEIDAQRWTLIREVEKLVKGHDELANKLDSTHHYLQMFESDSRELTDELTRVRLLSLTDELTGLPNRRAFMRRLEDEVARVQRYGFPLSLILIDMDHFKAVNDEYGHAAGDEVLRVYSKNILSIFRHHDMVARYGGEEFAVLLPNTDSDGSVRALNKVRRRASETRWQSNGTVLDVPTFSAGVSFYKSGESASAFIERADKALYRAKRLGRNRIELDMTYQSESAEDVPRRRSTD